MKHIGAIIATFNRIHYLRNIIDQLLNQNLPNAITLSIIVVNDGSTDGTVEMLTNEFPQVYIVNGTGNWWWTRCMNEGFKKAIELHADYVLVFNDDTEITPDYVSTLWADYQTLPDCTIMGSASISIEPKDLIDFAGTKDMKFWCMKTTPYLPNLTPLFTEFKGVHPTCTINGRGSLISASTFNKIGLFDENLVQYGSDDEFAIRARKAGIPVYISWNAKVYNHLLMTSEGTPFRKDSLWKFLKSFNNPYSVNYIKKTTYIYKKYGITTLTPFYLVYTFLGTLKAYLFKYRDI